MKLPCKVGPVLLMAAAFAACSSNDTRPVGPAQEGAVNSVGLRLQPVSGVTLNSVHFVVTKAGSTTPVLEGDLPAASTAKTAAFGLPIPVGTGYTLSLSALSVESATVTCAGSVGPFEVRANQSTNLTTTLACTDTANGSASNLFNIESDACPRLTVDFLTTTPSAANIGESIRLASAAHDLDGNPISFAWTILDGNFATFSSTQGANTTLTCHALGLNLDVAVTASNGDCSKVLTTQISCRDFTCGNGVRDPGEACDASAGDTVCLPNCTVPICGNGVVEPPFEECDPIPADPRFCNATCHSVRIECGDGFLHPIEECDGTLFPPGTPFGSTCDASCRIHPAHTVECNDGFKDVTEVCDPGLTAEDCGRDCGHITSAACFACENSFDTCQDFVNCSQVIGSARAGTPGAGIPRSNLCNEVLDCVRDSGCAAAGNAPIKCYCGTANATDCQNGLANGACKAEIERGLETVEFAQIIQRFRNPQFGGGLALARIDCDRDACPAPCNLQ